MKSLSDVKEFKGSENILAELKKSGSITKLKQGEILLRENHAIREIPIILSGSVKVYQTDEDVKEVLLYYLQEGETCIMSFLGGLYNDTSKVKAVADVDSEVLLIPVQKLGILTQKFPEWNNYIFRVYHQRFLELLDVIHAISFKKMDERLFNFIIQKTELTNSQTLHLTHEEIANELGTARVVVSRLLKQMEKKNLIKLGRNKITLL